MFTSGTQWTPCSPTRLP
eukprot:jgi/Astpho2/542/gw1.00012.34.1_t